MNLIVAVVSVLLGATIPITGTDLPATGNATYYNPGIFERVIPNRPIEITDCPECVGWAAMLYETDLGRNVYIQCSGCTGEFKDEIVGPIRIIDCDNPRNIPNKLSRDWVIDIDTWLAKRWGLWQWGPREVTVYSEKEGLALMTEQERALSRMENDNEGHGRYREFIRSL